MDCAAAILVGGLGRRMGGCAKGLIKVDGETILSRQLRTLRPLFEELFLVARDNQNALPYREFGLPITFDQFVGCGPLAGLHAALEFAQAPRIFLCACDMPSVQASVIQHVLSADPTADAVVPIADGRPHPLHACYAKTCLPAATRCLENQIYRMTDFLGGICVAWDTLSPGNPSIIQMNSTRT